MVTKVRNLCVKISLSFLFMSMKIEALPQGIWVLVLKTQNFMLTAIGCSTIDELIDKTVPSAIRLREPLIYLML